MKKNSETWKAAIGAAGLTYIGLLLFAKPLINIVNDLVLKRLMTDPYDEIFGNSFPLLKGQVRKLLLKQTCAL